MTNQRMKWDAKAAFKRIDEQIANDEPSERAAADRNEMAGFSYAPPSNIGPERLAQLRKYEPPAKPHGRDIESLMRYHEAHRKGRTDDDCLREKFGGQPLPSASTKPHGKDVDTADGPWPKRIMGAAALGILEGPHKGTAYYRSGTVCCISCKGLVDSWLNALQGSYRLASEAEALQWLEQNGHKDVAAQLRGKAINSLSIPTKLIGEEFEPERTIPVVGDRFNYGGEVCTVTRIDHTREFAVRFLRCEASHEDGLKISYFTDKNSLRILKRPVADNAIPHADVATGGGRVWEDGGFAWMQIGGAMYGRVPAGRFVECVPSLVSYMRPEWEKFGSERDAILSECRKAMQCPQKPAS